MRAVAGALPEEALASSQGVGDRRRDRVQADHEPLDDLTRLEAIAGAASVTSARSRPRRTSALAVEVMRLRHQPPGSRETELVTELLENGDRPVCDVDQLGRGRLPTR